ncbi:MAG: RimK family alpha-L-glutamate ligase [Planctomycetota bacterium]
MRLVVLGSPTSWYLADLRRAAGRRHEVLSATFRDLESSLGAAGVGVRSAGTNLHDADAVLVRSMAPGSLEQVVFRMDALAELQARGVRVVNPPRAIEAAVDKYLASARLRAAGLPTPRTAACQTTDAAMAAFDALGGRVVIKPLFGGEGRGVALLEDAAMARRAFALVEQLGGVIYLQEFIEHDGGDLRLLVMGRFESNDAFADARVLGMRRENPLDWRTNISLGGKAAPLEVTGELAGLACRAARAVGAPLAGVDLLPGRDGRLYAIEVNAVPGWRALGRVTGRDVAALVLDHIAAGLP